MLRVSLGAILVLVGASMPLAADERPKLSGVGGTAGIGQYPPNSWGISASTISNPTEKDVELLVNFRFDKTPNLEFATRAWVPAGCRRAVWIPIHTYWYEIDAGRPPHLELRQELIDDSGSQPVSLGNQDGLLIASRDRIVTAMLTDNGEMDDDSISVVLAARRAQDLSKRLAYVTDTSLPPFFSALQGLDGLVISKRSPVLDAAQLEALRQWLLSGGKLWIMLDQVDPSFAESLLGEAWTIQIIDQVDLTQVRFGDDRKFAIRIDVSDDLDVQIDGKTALKLGRGKKLLDDSLNKLRQRLLKLTERIQQPEDRRALLAISGAVDGNIVEQLLKAVRSATDAEPVVDRQHEMPVKCVRVLAPGFEVMHSVNGWPVSMQKPVGKGSVLVTTLGPRGWMEPVLTLKTNPDGSVDRDPNGQEHYAFAHFAHRPLEEISVWLHREREAEPLPPRAFTAYLNEQIGYQIVGRGTVMIVLTLLCAGILLSGMWLSKQGKLERLAFVAVAMAIVMSIAMVFIGSQARSAVPSTLAEAQFVQVAPDQQYAIVSGMFQVYNPGTGSGAIEGENATLKGDAGGLVLPMNLQHLGMKRVQLLWTDVDQWQWTNVPLPSGANLQAVTEHILPMHQPVRATVSFDENGVVGHVDGGSLGKLTDLLIATPTGRLAPQVSDDGTVHAGPGDALSAGQYAAGAMDDARRRRVAIVQSLLMKDESPDSSTIAGPARKEVSVDALGAPIGEQSTGLASAYPSSPVVLGWADALNLGFERPKVQQTVGRALVVLPLVIESPKAGATITIPSAFLPYSVERTQFGVTSPVYDSRKRLWINSPRPSAFALQFQLPPQVGAVKVNEATFTLDITAPTFKVEVGVERDGRLAILSTKTGQDGQYEVKLNGDDLQPDAQGRLTVILRINNTGEITGQLWRIRRVALDVTGIAGQ